MLADVFAGNRSIFGLFMKGSLSQRENKATGIVMVSVFLSGEMVSNLPGIMRQNFQFSMPLILQQSLIWECTD